MSDSRHTRPATTKRSQQTADDEGRQMKKKAHLQLEYIDAKYDDLDDAAHAALDIKTQEKMSKYDPEILINIFAKFGKALTTLAEDAHKSSSYKSIRNLVVLQKNVNLINSKLNHSRMDVDPLNEDVREMQKSGDI
ncbi:hypothetical protein EW145_g4542 [Phellinidium pouzarii]|uniref:Uncharacterized protein n=1 Tax=Phellinidium pouzarii TaxID=167371 RepID=A0A4S4L3A7_9AGAM|nr:hypothetical protein EW145_g4542 [Phellinidium pouzarii]